MTATPCRLDGLGLQPFCDALVLGPQISEVVPDYLCRAELFEIPPNIDLKELRGSGRDYSQKRLGAMQTGPVIADAVKNWRRLAYDRRTLFFAVDINHSKSIVERLRSIGVSAEHVDFKTSNREAILERYQSGATQCLSNVELFTEGVDAPATNCIVHARPTLSLTLYRQMNGRGFRKKDDGGDLVVVDCAGNSAYHGHPMADIIWELEHGVDEEARKSAAATHRRCENCDYVFVRTLHACPLCGVEPFREGVSEVDIDLESAGAPSPEPLKPTRREISRRVMATGGDGDKLEELRKEYGYHPQWTKRMKDIYRFAWPRGAQT